MTDTVARMNSMYRYQRYFYDLTRKYYLLGRDTLLRRMDLRPGENVLEIGCGTARNLMRLARRHPDCNFYGLDASDEMLKTAQKKIQTEGLKNIVLKAALAESFDHRSTFGLEQPFDKIFFSYSISMIPEWREAINAAIKNLDRKGVFYIVDFYDQKDLPVWFRGILKTWLRRFHVRFWDDLIPFLWSLDDAGIGYLELSSVARRYAFIANFHKR